MAVFQPRPVSSTPQSTKLIRSGIYLLLCGALIHLIAYVAVLFLPPEYTSEVTIEVKLQRIGILTQEDTDTLFLHDQIQIIQRKGIFYPVIDELGLVDKWSAGLAAQIAREDAYQRLLKMINIKQPRNTDILVVEVTSIDRQEAADIANTIVSIYEKRRRDDQEQLITAGLSELTQEVEEQRHKVDLAKTAFERIRDRDHVIDPNPDNKSAPPVTRLNPEYEAAKRELIEAKELLDSAEQRSETLKRPNAVTIIPIEILERAVPAKAPNFQFIQKISIYLGILCAVSGVILLCMGLRLKCQEAGSAQD